MTGSNTAQPVLALRQPCPYAHAPAAAFERIEQVTLLLVESSKPARCLDPVSTFRTVVQTDKSRDIYDSILVDIVATSRLPARLGATTTQRFGVKNHGKQTTIVEG